MLADSEEEEYEHIKVRQEYRKNNNTRQNNRKNTVR